MGEDAAHEPTADKPSGNLTLAAAGTCFVAGNTAYWMRHTAEKGSPDDADAWPPPIPIRSEPFRRALCAATPGLRPGSKRIKDLVAEYEDLAWQGRTIPKVDWYSYTDGVYRIAISPSVVVRVDKTGIHTERNGITSLYTLPIGFAPLAWRDLIAVADLENGHKLPRLREAITGTMPPPIPTDPVSAVEQEALLLACWLGIFLEPACQGRPILGIFGGYGTGKTVTARLLGKAYFGPTFDVGGGVGGSRAEKDLVAAMNAKPFTVRDDMNRESVAIVDKICALATGSVVELAVMHETLKFESFSARASLCITAHTPEWALRADLLSRMVPLRISQPPDSVLTEKDRQGKVVALRTAIWMDTLCAIYALSLVHLRWKCSTRFEDWETLARRCAHAGGWHGELHAGLEKLKGQRVRLACDTDPFLATLHQIAKEGEEDPRWYTASELYDLVSLKLGGAVDRDPGNRPSARALSNPKALGRFLSQIERDGAAVVAVERGPLNDNVATWRLRALGG